MFLFPSYKDKKQELTDDNKNGRKGAIINTNPLRRETAARGFVFDSLKLNQKL